MGLVKTGGCCADAAGELGQLRSTLKDRSSLEVRELAPGKESVVRTTSMELLVQDSLDRASKHYLNMKMEHAQQILEYMVRTLRQKGARGVAPELLARLRLYLGAVYLAAGQDDAAQRDFQAAVGIDPELVPDKDVFAPEIHQAVARARKALGKSAVRISTTPPGASVNWDGKARGQTPLALEGLSHGDHYLGLDRPLYRPWQDEVRISADAQLKIKLTPQPPGRLVAELIQRPALRLEGARLLELEHLLICSLHPDGLQVEVLTPRGQTREGRVVLSAKGGTAGLKQLAALVDQPLLTTPDPSKQDSIKKPKGGRRSSSRWPWIVGGAAVAVGVALAVILPLTLSGSSDSDRPVHLTLP